MKPYTVDVRSILEDMGGSISVNDTLEMDALVVGEEKFELREPVSFSVTISNAGTGIVVYGTVHADVTATCSRCVCSFDDEIDGDVEGVYTRYDQEPLGDEGTGVVDTEGRIDLSPALLAGLVIEAPFAPLHDDECAGLCAGCGIDLNTEQCECDKQPSSDHPFAALRSLLSSEDEGEQDGDT